jgi:hypothetical protein
MRMEVSREELMFLIEHTTCEVVVKEGTVLQKKEEYVVEFAPEEEGVKKAKRVSQTVTPLPKKARKRKSQKAWSYEDLKILRDGYFKGESCTSIADQLGRNISAVYQKGYELGLKRLTVKKNEKKSQYKSKKDLAEKNYKPIPTEVELSSKERLRRDNECMEKWNKEYATNPVIEED